MNLNLRFTLPVKTLTTMTRREISKVLKRHRGSQAEIARRAGGINITNVGTWLKGRSTSAKVELYANEVASELLAKEAARNPKRERPSVREVLPVIRSQSSESQG